ncbi:Cdc6/Cdc18 family protein (plasmid) [Haloferax prahovense]|uniref:Cdc6/Cdc18 family protein n=1 Tax=Haloferax prahovense TaxID=381852 RepID=UPI003C750C93
MEKPFSGTFKNNDSNLFDDELTDNIFENRKYLSTEWRPEKILQRDEEVSQYIDALKPALLNQNPTNIFVYGKTGVGKTAVSKKIIADLAAKGAELEINVTTAYLNLEDRTSTYQATVGILNALLPADRQIPESGYSQSVINNMLWDRMDEIGGVIYVILDEIDSLDGDDGILYQIPRAVEEGKVTDANPGLIGISNNLKFHKNLRPKVRDSLCEWEIRFSTYNANQLYAILAQRAKKAFEPGVIDDAAISLAAALAARDSGSARQAIRLLKSAGSLADAAGDTNVTESHVESSFEDLQSTEMLEELKDSTRITRNDNIALWSLSMLTEHQNGSWFSTSEVRAIYNQVRSKNGDPIVSQRAVLDHLNDLHMLGFIDKRNLNKGRGGGSFNQYQLDLDVGLILSLYDDPEYTWIPSCVSFGTIG